MAKHYPVGKAQQIVLDALDLSADSFGEADKIFAEYGLMVIAKRQGRKSVPEVYLLDATIGGWTPGGDGTAQDVKYKEIDFNLIKEWIKE
jgi:hypothetical protein